MEKNLRGVILQTLSMCPLVLTKILLIKNQITESRTDKDPDILNLVSYQAPGKKIRKYWITIIIVNLFIFNKKQANSIC